MNNPARTTDLLAWLGRMRAGDLAARDELLRGFGDRLKQLAHKMLRRFPSVGRWTQTDDVLQNSMLRLLRALEQVRPATMQAFFRLAAEQIRRELLDLARRFSRGARTGDNPAGPVSWADSQTAGADLPDHQVDDPSELEHWCAIHQAVEKLPLEERAVVRMLYYDGWTQVAVAQQCRISVRTVQRRWEVALSKLHRLLKT